MQSQRFLQLLEEAAELHRRKNAGYAGKDNPDPWANFRLAENFGVSAFRGCMVRLSDKFIRVGNLVKDSENEMVGESIVDTLRDLAAYSYIAICLYEEEQKKELGNQDGFPF